MKNDIESQVYEILSLLDIKVSRKLLKKYLRSHFAFPSLLSITDTFDVLGIENTALIVDKKNIKELPTPFLAHMSGRCNEFIVVKDFKKQISNNPALYEAWTGVILIIEAPDNFQVKENNELLLREKFQRSGRIAIASLLLLLLLLSVDIPGKNFIILLLLSLTGMYISILIVQQDLGFGSELTDHLCSLNKQANCNAVLKSKHAKIYKQISWSDAGLIYFSSFTALLVLFSLGKLSSVFFTLSVISAFGVPFIFYSIYYQLKVIKSWCPLCLITISLLALQFMFFMPQVLGFSFKYFKFNSTLLTAFVFVSISYAWLDFVKPLLKTNKRLDDENYSFTRFKNDPETFSAILRTQPQVKSYIFDDDFQICNPGANLQMIVCCNPYCMPCSKAHKVIHEIAEKYSEFIKIAIRFSVDANEMEDKGTKAVQYIFQHLKEATKYLNGAEKILYNRKALQAWYTYMDLNRFSSEYILKKETDVSDLLKQHQNWVRESNVRGTPEFILNGFKVPKQYSITDILKMMKGLISEFGDNQAELGKNIFERKSAMT